MFRLILGDNGASGRSARTAALIGLQVVSLLLGAVGVRAFDSGSLLPAAWLPEAFAAQTEPVDSPPACDEGAVVSVADIAEMVNPAVVTITNGQEGFAPGGADGAVPVGAGTGFIIDTDGRVVTNSHVVAGADELTVEFYDGSSANATLVGRDPLQDVAVIQLDLSDGLAVPGVVTFGDSDEVRAGDRIIAIGSALGQFTNTVTEGTVSGKDRSLGGYGLSNLIQHDSSIWRGNSGGPLLNLQGEVIGINFAGINADRATAAIAPAEMAFAIESNAARAVVEELIATGTVVRPYLGIQSDFRGVSNEIARVFEDGPSAEAGLEAGDVILALNGERVSRQNSLLDLLFEYDPGDTVTLTIERGDAELEIDVELGERLPEAE